MDRIKRMKLRKKNDRRTIDFNYFISQETERVIFMANICRYKPVDPYRGKQKVWLTLIR